jgi:hypothetical protein
MEGRALLGTLFVADERFVHFHSATGNAKRHGQPTLAHRLSDTMAGKPRRLERATERARQLIAANALLARAKQISRLKPLMQLQVRSLENRTLSDRELATAGIALAKAKAFDALRMLLAGFATNAFERADLGCIAISTERANRTVRPQDFLQRLKGRCLIVEICFVQNASHNRTLIYVNKVVYVAALVNRSVYMAMGFKAATDLLFEKIGAEELAAELGCSPQAIKQARMAEGASGRRSPPPGWEAALSQLARQRATALAKLADRLK